MCVSALCNSHYKRAPRLIKMQAKASGLRLCEERCGGRGSRVGASDSKRSLSLTGTEVSPSALVVGGDVRHTTTRKEVTITIASPRLYFGAGAVVSGTSRAANAGVLIVPCWMVRPTPDQGTASVAMAVERVEHTFGKCVFKIPVFKT